MVYRYVSTSYYIECYIVVYLLDLMVAHYYSLSLMRFQRSDHYVCAVYVIDEPVRGQIA